jgi:glucose-1-phosphate thymidylyltransferase
VKAIVLAAGYATRLRPLTDTWAKELLPVGGRPILDGIVESIEAVDEVDAVHVVTNAVKAPAFRAWAERRRGDVRVHDDGTSTNDDRLGAIGDMQFVIEREGIDDDLLVIAGDNLFDFDVSELVRFWRSKGEHSVVAVRDVGTKELARQYGVIELDADERVVDFVEKPDEPRSTLAAIATYLYGRRHIPLIKTYLADGNPPDQPGLMVAWLQEREPVYGWTFDSTWYDIGNLEQLLEADNRLRAARGLPQRDTYSPDA